MVSTRSRAHVYNKFITVNNLFKVADLDKEDHKKNNAVMRSKTNGSEIKLYQICSCFENNQGNACILLFR